MDAAVNEHDQLSRLKGRPGFVVGQGLGGNDGNAIVRCGDGGKIDGQIGVDEIGRLKGPGAGNVVKPCRTVGDQALAVGKQEVVDAVAGQFGGDVGHG